MSPPTPRQDPGQDSSKLIRIFVAFTLFGFAVAWVGTSGRGEAPISKLTSRLSDRWDASVAKAQSAAKVSPVLTPLLKRREPAHSKSAAQDSGMLGSQAVPSLNSTRSKASRKATQH